MLVVPDPNVESAKSTACLCQSVVHLFVDSCIRGDGAPQVGELLDCFSSVSPIVMWGGQYASWGGGGGGGLVENLCLLQADFETEELGCLCEAGCYTLQGCLVHVRINRGVSQVYSNIRHNTLLKGCC